MKLHSSLRRRTVLTVVVGALLGAALGAVATSVLRESYVASITMYIAPPTSSSPTDAVMGDQYAANRAQLYLSLVTSDPLLATVSDALDPPPPAKSIAGRVDASLINQTSLIRIDATGDTAESAAGLARAYGVVFPDFARSVEAQSGIREGPTVSAISSPDQIVATRVGLSSAVSILLFAALFALLGWGISAWYKRKDPSVGDPRNLRRHIAAGFVEQVNIDRDSVNFQRVQALLFGSRSGAPLLFVAPSDSDPCVQFVDELVSSALSRGVSVRSVALVDIEDDVVSESRSTLYVSPSMLDDSRQAALLGFLPFDAVIVCRRSRTSVRSVVEAAQMLEKNGASIRGVLIVRAPSLLVRVQRIVGKRTAVSDCAGTLDRRLDVEHEILEARH